MPLGLLITVKSGCVKFYEGIGLDGLETDSKGMIEYPESVKGYTKKFKLGMMSGGKSRKNGGKYIRLMGYGTENSRKCSV